MEAVAAPAKGDVVSKHDVKESVINDQLSNHPINYAYILL
jgi:hypothetical protein